jgi:vancomycin resistance protein YoaR
MCTQWRLKGDINMRKLIICISVILICGCGCNSSNRKIENGVQLENSNVGGLSQKEAKKVVEDFAKNLYSQPKNAGIDKEKWEIVPETIGKRVNIEKTIESLMNSKEGDKIKLVTEDVNPDITSQTMQSYIVEIGSFSTPILSKQENRIDNIEVASEDINNIKLMPGEEFSFNDVLGKRTKSKGYKEAPIIIQSKDGPKKGYGVGGGICQISSTLYNAAEKSGLEITERHAHSKNVGYVPEGKDATVVYDSIDFKFKNNHQYPIMIKVFLTQDNVTVKIYENRGIDYIVSFIYKSAK